MLGVSLAMKGPFRRLMRKFVMATSGRVNVTLS